MSLSISNCKLLITKSYRLSQKSNVTGISPSAQFIVSIATVQLKIVIVPQVGRKCIAIYIIYYPGIPDPILFFPNIG